MTGSDRGTAPFPAASEVGEHANPHALSVLDHGTTVNVPKAFFVQCTSPVSTMLSTKT